MKQVKIWLIIILTLGSMCVVSCNDDEIDSSIILLDGEQNIVCEGDNSSMPISIRWRELLFQIRGGNGNFMISNDNEEVVNAKCDSRTVTLVPLILGKANLTIKDTSGNILSISVNVKVDKSVATVISSPSCRIYGEKMNDQDKADLERKISSTYKEGGEYHFIYESKSVGEKVQIYPQKLDDIEYKEYDSKYKGEIPESLIPSQIHEQIYYWYVFKSNKENLALFCIRDEMSAKRKSNNIRMNFIDYIYLLDVTSQYKMKYPNLERAYIQQSLRFQNID